MTWREIPPEIKIKYEALFQEVCHLHRKWGVFRELYVSGTRIELLNNSAPGFFNLCKDLFGDDIILTICRLNDPKRTFQKDNLTLEQLVYSVEPAQHPRLRDELEVLLGDSKTKCTFAKDHRNKRIAHNDLDTKLNAKVRPLPSPTTTNIDDALRSICEVLNAVPRYFHQSDTGTVDYSSLVSRPGVGRILMSYLREAEQTRHELAAQKSGNV
jgi:hypothetical protein